MVQYYLFVIGPFPDRGEAENVSVYMKGTEAEAAWLYRRNWHCPIPALHDVPWPCCCCPVHVSGVLVHLVAEM